MFRALRQHLSYANVMATTAAFIALGGVGYAAVKLPKNSVGAAQIRAKAVTGSKLSANAVTGAKVLDGSLGPADFTGAAVGPTGPQGAAGVPGIPGVNGSAGGSGARGPSDAYYAFDAAGVVDMKTLNLPLTAGKYAVSGSMLAATATAARVDTSCVLDAIADATHSGSTAHTFLADASAVPVAVETLLAQTVLDLPSGGTARMACQKSTGSATFSQARIVAIKVATLN